MCKSVSKSMLFMHFEKSLFKNNWSLPTPFSYGHSTFTTDFSIKLNTISLFGLGLLISIIQFHFILWK